MNQSAEISRLQAELVSCVEFANEKGLTSENSWLKAEIAELKRLNEALTKDADKLPSWFEAFILRLCEIDDRNSPDDQPEMLLVTQEELRRHALHAIETEIECCSSCDDTGDIHSANGQYLSERTSCPLGHEFSGDNLVFTTKGVRQCRECNNIKARKC